MHTYHIKNPTLFSDFGHFSFGIQVYYLRIAVTERHIRFYYELLNCL